MYTQQWNESSHAAVIEQFNEQGFVILKNFFEPAVVQRAIKAMKKLVDVHAEKLLKENKTSDLLINEPFETRLYQLYANYMDIAPKSLRKELHLAELFDVFFNEHLLDVIELFLGGEIRLYPNYSARPKFPEWDGTQVLWHQDAGYTESGSTGNESQALETLRMVNVWMPLVPVNVENGCMQFIPKTHKLGVVSHEKKEHYLQISADVLNPKLSQAVDVIMDPGDLVFFNNLLFHQGQPNVSKHIRWSIDWRYQDALQLTNRKDQGHIARSHSQPQNAVQNKEQWEQLTWQ